MRRAARGLQARGGEGVSGQAILVVSDLHCGSIYGMLPPDFAHQDGTPKIPNPGQEYLWACWLDMIQRVSKLPIFAVVVNGDAVEGEERRAKGAELCMPLMNDQAECAAVCLRELKANLKNDPPIFVIRGTPYHDSEGGNTAETVADKISARPYKGYGAGRLCHRAMDLEHDGVIVNFSHGTSVAGGLYRATPPDREAVWSALAGKEGKTAKADAVVRGHAHIFVHVEHPSKHAVIGPAWQLQTDYMGKNSCYRMLPDLGAILIWVDGEAKRRREDPISVQKILYPLPRLETQQV
jgi:hypothetical protein